MKKHIITLLAIACCTVRAAAQDFPNTAQATGGVGLHGQVRPFFGAGGLSKPFLDEAKVSRTVVEARSGGRLVARWTTEYRPSVEDWERQVAESMANRQSFMDHHATKTVVAEEAGRDPMAWAGSPADEAFGRLNDTLELPGALEEGLLFEVHGPPAGLPPMDDKSFRRLLEPWSPQHGFGAGRAD